jgi:hypothetical protein
VTPTGKKRVQGLRALLQDAVEHGSAAVERVHRQTADRTFTAIELIPRVAGAARVVRGIHGVALSGVYGSVRVVNRAVGAALAAVIEQAIDADDE